MIGENEKKINNIDFHLIEIQRFSIQRIIKKILHYDNIFSAKKICLLRASFQMKILKNIAGSRIFRTVCPAMILYLYI